MIVDVAGAWNVTGSRSDIAPTGPMPGNTPTSVPINTPKKQYTILTGIQTVSPDRVNGWKERTVLKPIPRFVSRVSKVYSSVTQERGPELDIQVDSPDKYDQA